MVQQLGIVRDGHNSKNYLASYQILSFEFVSNKLCRTVNKFISPGDKKTQNYK